MSLNVQIRLKPTTKWLFPIRVNQQRHFKKPAHQPASLEMSELQQSVLLYFPSVLSVLALDHFVNAPLFIPSQFLISFRQLAAPLFAVNSTLNHWFFLFFFKYHHWYFVSSSYVIMYYYLRFNFSEYLNLCRNDNHNNYNFCLVL